ncbi:MAG: tetratricopeptide repeat protein [Anaerolineales bacterium]|nr:tetratricopeptide repeat protein [Anaerolineales bacterium]
MAKVSLRIYNREIERLVEQGHTDEAIAHCRHILKTFPKHLETYRLLGKAYLEARRYGEAVDIFGRLLMAVPDDFVAHVGLSIIRDEENKLDDAIWHMERAFEVQSSNGAIQGELQRLYGRRDGMEPPKIRMTRGALARIYVLGELYPQAIAEIRGVLAEDPQRVDMQVLLAHSLFKSGLRSDATDICNQLLKRYAYSFDANRIMVELLPATAGVESTQVYRMHISEMDPYSNFAKGSIFQTSDVPDASVSLERLEYSGEEVPMGQDWNNASLGFSSVPPLGDGLSFGNEQPEWLRGSGDETPQSSDMPESQADAGEGIPDFLRSAGWGASNGPETPTSIFDEEPADSNIVQADIPDWLKSQAPSASQAVASEPLIETSNLLGSMDDSFDPFGGVDTPIGDTPDWLKNASEPAAPIVPSIETSRSQPLETSSDVPDWLKGLDTPAAEAAPENGDTPDWLAGLGGMTAVAAVSASEDLTAAESTNLPDWLQASEPQKESPAASVETLGASAQEQDDAVAWLESLAAKHGAKPEELVTDPNKRSETPPEWVAQAQNVGAQAAPSVETLGASAQEQDDAVAWLESLAAKHGAKPEELVTDPNKRSETPPEWVAQAQNVGAQAAAPSVENLGASAQEQDDAVAWLESLAAKHGAKPEELVTDPNKRSETPPEWVAQAQSIGAQAPAESEPVKPEWSETAANVGEEFFAEFEKASSSQPDMDATGMWLKSLDEDEKETPVADSSDLPDWMKPEAQEEQPLERGSIPEWLNDTEPVQNQRQPGSLDTSSLPDWLGGLDKPEEPDLATEESLVKNQDLTDWLSGLDDEPGLNIDPATLRAPQPPLETKTPAGKPVAEEALPDWMQPKEAETEEEDSWKPPVTATHAEPEAAEEDTWKPVEVTPPAAPQAVPVSLSADLPDWLQSMDEEQAEGNGDDTPPWVHREQWEADGAVTAQPPKPTSPSDWQPVAAAQKQEPAEQPVPQQTRGGQRLMQNPPSPEPVAPAEKKKSPAKQQQGLPRQRKPEAQGTVNVLGLAKSELDRGDIPEALVHYGKLIKKGKHLEEVIGNLTESLYRYPVEVSIWQALGDAYMRANRLKEALEAYNKAEELIR